MILKRVTYYATAVVALCAAAVICVVALASALHAALEPSIGPAWASVAVAAAALLLMALLAALLFAKAKRQHLPNKKSEDRDLTSRLFELARDKPLVAIGAIGAAAVIVLKNPKITAAIFSAVMAGRASKK